MPGTDHIHTHQRSGIIDHTPCNIMHHTSVMHHTCNIIHHTTHLMRHHASIIRHMHQLHDTLTLHAYDDAAIVNNCRVGDRSKTNCRTASSSPSSTQSLHALSSSSSSSSSSLHLQRPPSQNNAPCIWPTSEGRTTESGVRGQAELYSH